MNDLSRLNPTSDKEKKSRSTCFNLMEVFVKREIFAQLKKLPVNTRCATKNDRIRVPDDNLILLIPESLVNQDQKTSCTWGC
jgi:hypothetical protein